MDVKAVATYGDLRFMLNDFTYGGKPNFYLNIAQLEGPDDLVGLHVGHPISIEPAIVGAADARAQKLALSSDETQLMVVAYVLTTDSIKQKLSAKPGGLPIQMADFFAQLDIIEEKSHFLATVPSADVKAVKSSRL